MPKISVIIPAYNSERYIRLAIESVLCQSEQDFEIVVIDDGSTDGTLSIVKSLAEYDNRIRVITQPNSGKPSIARNAGIKNSSGDFVCFLDADDLYFPNKLEKQLKVFQKYPHLNLVFHDVKLFTENSSKDQGSYLVNTNFIANAKDYVTAAQDGIYLCKENFFNYMSVYSASLAIPNVMVRRSCLDAQAVWFPEDTAIGEDVDLWFRLALSNRLACIFECLSYYRRHDNNITNHMEGYLKGSIQVHGRNLKRGLKLLTKTEIKEYEKKILTMHWHYGYLLYSKYETSLARHQFMNALKIKFSTKAFIALLKTMLPVSFIKLYKAHLKPC